MQAVLESNVSTKYGFYLQFAEANAPAVAWYREDHLRHYGYPPDVELSSQTWVGVCREDKVWGVVGFKPLSDKMLEVPDFFFHRSRWGILAAYAALEALKNFSDATGMSIVTATPVWNTRQMKAQAKVFGVDGPTDHIYRYIPKAK